MIPRTYPSQVNSTTGRVEMKVSFISSLTGLTRWVDYIPVSFVTDATPTEGSYDNDGYIAVVDVGSTSGLQAGKDYIRVYLDSGATDAWQVNSVGYIPVGYSGIGGIPYALFANNEVGVWYDPSDLTTMFQDAAGTTPVTAVEQAVGLILDKSKGLVLGSELVVSQDLTNAQWTQLPATPASSTTATTLTFGGQFSGRADTISVSAGKIYLFSFQVRRVSGNTTLRIYYDAVQQTNGVADFTVDGNWKTVSRVVYATTSSVDFGWQDRNAAGHGTIELRNISVRELPGNHAYQSASTTSRPVYSRRYNLLTKTEQFDDSAWTKTNASSTNPVVTRNAAPAPDGTTTAASIAFGATSGSGASIVLQVYNVPISTNFSEGLYVKAATSTDIGKTLYIYFSNVPGIAGLTGIVLTNEWQRISNSAALTSGTIVNVTFGAVGATLGGSNQAAFSAHIWGASLVPANQSSLPYQRVNTSTDYDADPTKFPAYLRFDGSDDWLVTNTITPGTDKAQVFAGVRKLSDASGIFLETSANYNNNNGAIILFTDTKVSFGESGTGGNAVNSSVYASPVTHVVSGLADRTGTTGPTTFIRLGVNGVDDRATYAYTDNDSGNFLAYPLYIGRRAGTSLPFNGHLYQLIVRFGATPTASVISATETYVNNKTKAY